MSRWPTLRVVCKVIYQAIVYVITRGDEYQLALGDDYDGDRTRLEECLFDAYFDGCLIGPQEI